MENKNDFRSRLEIKKRFMDKENRMTRVMAYTMDHTILGNINFVAFDQVEFDYIISKEPDRIYLCGEIFEIPVDIYDIEYIGINNPIVKIMSHIVVNFEEKNISFTNTTFDKDYTILMNDYEKYLELRQRFKSNKTKEDDNKIKENVKDMCEKDKENLLTTDESSFVSNKASKTVNNDCKSERKTIENEKINEFKYISNYIIEDLLDDDEKVISKNRFDRYVKDLYNVKYDYSYKVKARVNVIKDSGIVCCALKKFNN